METRLLEFFDEKLVVREVGPIPELLEAVPGTLSYR
jgi:hypothetical protein